jgi:cytochrome c oxidase subunit 3
MHVSERTAGPLPERGAPLVPSGVIAIVLFVFTETMLFAGLISAHVIFVSEQVGEMWPPLNQPRLPFEETALNTAALLVSGFVLLMAEFGFRLDPRRAVIPLGAAIALGAFFVGFQGAEWIGLTREGLTMTSSSYGAFFYLIVGAHAIHALAALACLAWAWLRLRQRSLSEAEFRTVQIFWYFVVLLWPVIYLQVYR